VIAGRYSLGREIGRGGTGTVWLGRDEVLGREVAIKRVGVAPGGTSPDLVRAEREARIAARVNHPHVVAIFDLVEHDDQQWLVMEYVDGPTLADLVRDQGPMPPDAAAAILAQAAEALSAAHAAGVVHRDVKPSNLVVAKQVVKVTDFGLAKALQEDLSITATGVFVGTPDYLAPEQAMGEDVDSSADVYALGCSLYHMCTGNPPFRKGGSDDHYTAVVRRHLKAERPVLKAQISGFDDELSDLCRRMMSRRPDVRPTLEQLIEDLPKITSRIGGQIPPRHASVAVEAEPPPPVEPAPSQAEDPRAELASAASQKTWIMAISIGIVIGVAVALLVMLLVTN
jgi:serine/threonine protein kinase